MKRAGSGTCMLTQQQPRGFLLLLDMLGLQQQTKL
jgi:hypothetical protein